MRKLEPITKKQITNAIAFVEEKSGASISVVELCYIVSSSGINTLVGFNFQDSKMNIRFLAGNTEGFIRQFQLTGDRTMSIMTPIKGTKIDYKFCSPDWSCQKELEYQESKGNTIEGGFSAAQAAAFENVVFCDLVAGYTNINDDSEIFDMRVVNSDNERLFDLCKVVDHVYELDKQEPRYQFGRQRFQVNQFIDYLCKND
ncbi:MAG: hypothetical protein P8J32_06785 [bacterium]|nr:hypothetical protein [bacterium]